LVNLRSIVHAFESGADQRFYGRHCGKIPTAAFFTVSRTPDDGCSRIIHKEVAQRLAQPIGKAEIGSIPIHIGGITRCDIWPMLAVRKVPMRINHRPLISCSEVREPNVTI
jgi:hypothetical protein